MNDKFQQKYLLNFIEFNINRMENILFVFSHRLRKNKNIKYP